MTDIQHIPLDRLALNLLALAEVSDTLSSEQQQELTKLVDDLPQPDTDTDAQITALTRLGLRIQLLLYTHKPFMVAKQAWDALHPEQIALDTAPLMKMSDNQTHAQPPVIGLTQIVLDQLHNLEKENPMHLAILAETINLPWPRTDKSGDAASEMTHKK